MPLLDYLPILAAAFAIPQFLPQLRKLHASGDAAGVSWAWATLSSVNNGAWFAYFLASGYLTALIPSSSASVLAGTLSLMLAKRGLATARSVAIIAGWAALLVAGFALAGAGGLGTLLTAAFILQVVPSIWTAYRTWRPTGISKATWLLVLGELSCWLAFGIYRSDARLTILGASGVVGSVLMVLRVRSTNERSHEAASA
jgi:uncharacterized protein with PQ loop repeat